MKNKVLKTITALAVICYTVGACGLDSDSAIPYIMCGVSLLWIGLFMYANKDRLEV